MLQQELIASVATDAGVTRETADKVIKSLAAVMQRELREGREVSHTSLGIFKVEDKPARVARNPRTGAEVQVPARKALKIKPAKGLRDAAAAAS